MRLEIHLAINFIAYLIRINRNGLSEPQLQRFKRSLADRLKQRYKDHWFPRKPLQGSGYRCLRINRVMDPVVLQAGNAVGLPCSLLHKIFPRELTVWIDPDQVSYRFGEEDGSICHLYEGTDPSSSEWKDFVTDRIREPENGGSGSSSKKKGKVPRPFKHTPHCRCSR